MTRLSAPALLLAGCRLNFDYVSDGADAGVFMDAMDPGTIRIEAESGSIVAPFRIEEHPMMTGVFYVIDGNPIGTPGGPGSAGYTFQVTVPGAYYLWGRVITTDTVSDSFFSNIDGQVEDYFVTACVYGPDWHWSPSVTGTVCPMVGPRRGYLFDAGDHTMVLTSREGGTLVDQFIFTNNPAFTP